MVDLYMDKAMDWYNILQYTKIAEKPPSSIQVYIISKGKLMDFGFPMANLSNILCNLPKKAPKIFQIFCNPGT